MAASVTKMVVHNFTKWSDGSTNASRTDTNVAQNKSFTAYFN